MFKRDTDSPATFVSAPPLSTPESDWLFFYHVPDPPSSVTKMSSNLPIYWTLTQSEMAGSVYDF
jgi:hypothetical protein